LSLFCPLATSFNHYSAKKSCPFDKKIYHIDLNLSIGYNINII